MIEATITWTALKNMAPESTAAIEDCDAGCTQFLAWAPLSPLEESTMIHLGRLVPDDSEVRETMSTYPGSNYWLPDDLIAMAWYPYNFCEVFQRKNCNSYYLVYTEFGGHIPERRARLVLKYLILTEDNA